MKTLLKLALFTPKLIWNFFHLLTLCQKKVFVTRFMTSWILHRVWSEKNCNSIQWLISPANTKPKGSETGSERRYTPRPPFYSAVIKNPEINLHIIMYMDAPSMYSFFHSRHYPWVNSYAIMPMTLFSHQYIAQCSKKRKKKVQLK